MNLYFTYKSRDTQGLLSVFLIVKTISTLIMKHSIKLEIEI